MDSYIDPEALDQSHPLIRRKLDNLARADAAMDSGAIEVDALPSKVTFQTTDACNLACGHCQIPKQFKTHAMSESLLDQLAARLLPDLIELHPTNLGEPFAWRHFRRLCVLMAEFGVVLDLTTNGTRLDRDRLEWIAPIARDVKVSFDGATAATFERFRVGASFDAVCANVRALVQRLRRVRSRRPIVALQMTLMRDNVDELPALVRLASQLGVDRVKAYHLFSFNEATREQSLMVDLRHYEEHVLPTTLALGAELGIDLQLAEPSGGDIGGLRKRRCFLPWHETWVDFDGSILLCHSHGDQVAGHLHDFQGAWNGPLYHSVRRGLAEDRPVGACDGCGMNFEKVKEHSPVPYDPRTFVDGSDAAASVRWSGRMRQFDLRGRRAWAPSASASRSEGNGK
ncbi:radical SAM protein [Myxococcota bacterium]|nr:radical SAM protein [Myxococcota bacterium]